MAKHLSQSVASIGFKAREDGDVLCTNSRLGKLRPGVRRRRSKRQIHHPSWVQPPKRRKVNMRLGENIRDGFFYR